MAKPFQASAAAMLFERNDALVIEAFRRGEFDYLDGVGEIPEADFLRAIASNKVLDKLADAYPSPRSKHDVPLWVYALSHQLHPVEMNHTNYSRSHILSIL